MYTAWSFVSTHAEESGSFTFHPLFAITNHRLLLTPAFSKGNSAVSLEECVLVLPGSYELKSACVRVSHCLFMSCPCFRVGGRLIVLLEL